MNPTRGLRERLQVRPPGVGQGPRVDLDRPRHDPIRRALRKTLANTKGARRRRRIRAALTDLNERRPL